MTQPATAPSPRLVRAQTMSLESKEYPTKLLADMTDFRPPQEVKLDKYGGLVGPKEKATGFFYPKQMDGRWWLIDPEGNRFLHVAVCGVGPISGPQGTEALPTKFGTKEKWRDETAELLWGLGFNGTGTWSSDKLLATAPRRLVYTPIWNFMSSYGKKSGRTHAEPGHTGYPNKCIMVFDPEFETFCDEHARQLAATKDDPYLLGHFSDNEMPFPKDSLDRYLGLEEKDPGRQAAEKWLAARHEGKLDKALITEEDRKQWAGFVADRYFEIVSKAIRKHDPNHLYLGSRFYSEEKSNQAVFAAAGKHCDVVSVNLYLVWTPDASSLQRWARWAGKPILITEWYARAMDSGLPNKTGAGWTVATQQERGWFYQNFSMALLKSKAVVGWHWFKYSDNDPTDPKAELSNKDSNKGMVRTNYEPYQPLTDLMKELNRNVYPLVEHLDAPK